MKIFLLSKVPPKFEILNKPSRVLPIFQPQYHWAAALESMGHKVIHFIYSDSLLLPRKLSANIDIYFQEMVPYFYYKYHNLLNRLYKFNLFNYFRSYKLIKLINSKNPDAIIIAGGISKLTDKALIHAKNKNIKIYLLNGEDPQKSVTNFEKNNINQFDWIVVNDPIHQKNWLQLGAKNVIALPYSGIDDSFHQDYKQDRDIPVLFIGSLFKERQEILKSIISFNPKIYGYIPPEIGLDPKLKPYYKGEAWGEKMVSLLNRTKIAINFVPDHMPIGGNLRMFEIPGCGALQITNRCPHDWFEQGKEIIIFTSKSHLKDKINYYLNNDQERNKIVKSSYIKTHKKYTYEQRFKTILSL